MSKNSWFSIQAKKGAPKSLDVSIHDEIGLWGISAKQFISDLDAAGDADEIHLSIHSPGGSVMDGWAIFNRLQSHPARVTATVDGIAASMASVIFMAADERRMPENAHLMIHRPTWLALGDAEDLDDAAQALVKIENGIVNAYVKASGQSEEDIRSMMDHETYITGAEAVEWGFADTLLENVKAAAVARGWVDHFEALPSDVVLAPKAPTAKLQKPISKPIQVTQNPKTMSAENAQKSADTKSVSALSDLPENLQEEMRKEAIKSEGDRRNGIAHTAERFKIPEAKVSEAIDKGTSVEAFQKWVTESFNPDDFNANFRASDETTLTGLPKKDMKDYSLVKAVSELASGKGLTGLEAEVQQGLSERYQNATGEAAKTNGVLIPGEVSHGFNAGADQRDMRNAATVGTDTEGGHTVATEVRSIIDILHDFMILPRVGATFLPDLTGNIKFPRLTTDYSGTWDAETDTIALADAVFGELNLAPNRVGAGTSVSNMLLRQSGQLTENWFRGKLGGAIGRAIDRGGITGTGTDAPQGVIGGSGVTAHTMNVANPLWEEIVTGLWAKARAAASPVRSYAFLSTETTAADWAITPKVSGQDMFCLEGTPNSGFNVFGYPFVDHIDVTSDRVVFGDFSWLLIGLWGGLQVVVDPYTSKTSSLVEVYVEAFADVGLEQAAAFVVTANAGTVHA